MSELIHIIPVGGDEPLHLTDETCWCHPFRNEIEQLVHNAKDCRERFERQGLSCDEVSWILVKQLLIR